MKILVFFIVLAGICSMAHAQSTLPLRADTVTIERVGGNATLKIKSATRDSVGGVLTNIGGGVTVFRKSRKLNDSTFVVGGDTIIISGGGSGSDTTIGGIPIRDSSQFYNKWYHGQTLMYNYPDSAFYPQFPTLQKIEIARGSGLKTFGHSLASPSVTPPTSAMHSTLLVQTIQGPDSNLAVGGTGLHDQLARINQEDHLRKRETQPLLLCIGIDNREDTTIYADRPVYHTAGIFAAVRSHRDTIVLPAGMTFTGTWTDFGQGLAAGSRTDGMVTSTSGDHYQFQITGKSAFFTFFSHSPNVDATNYTDSVTVTVDGTYHSSHSMADIGIMGTSTPYMGIIFIHGLSDAAHDIRVINQRNKPMAVDFAGSLDEGKYIAPILCEFVSPVGNGYISGTGAWKKLRINRLNKDYSLFITNNLTRWGIPAICVNPLDGFDPNTQTLDNLHPDSVGQRMFYNSIMRQIVIVRHSDTSNFWNKNGNAGTTTSNFIGTTDNVAFTIKSNNVRRALFGTNDQVALTQFATATQQGDFAAGSSIANGPFATALNRSQATNQGAFSAGEPGCLASGYASFAQGISQATASRTAAFINAKAQGDNSGALGYGVIAKSFGEIVLGVSDDTTGSYLWSPSTIVKNDPAFRIGIGEMDGLGDPINRRTGYRMNKSGVGLFDTAQFYVAGRVPVTTTTADSNMLMARKHVLDLVGSGSQTLQQVLTAGSTLTTNNTIANGTNQLDITGSRNFGDGYTFGVTNTTGTTGVAIKGIAADGRGVWGVATSGTAIYGNATDGYGVFSLATAGNALYAQSGDGLAIEAIVQPASTNTVVTVVKSTRVTTGTPTDGIGHSYDFENQTTVANRLSNQIISKWTTATDASRTSQFEIWGVNSATLARKFAIAGSGQLTLDGYGTGTHTGTPAYDLQATSSGAVIEKVAAKTYTALITQSGTSDPTVVVLGTNSIGTIVWARSVAGTYTGTLTGAFTSNKTWCNVSLTDESGGAIILSKLSRVDANTVQLITYNSSVVPADVFTNMSIEIRIYP